MGKKRVIQKTDEVAVAQHASPTRSIQTSKKVHHGMAFIKASYNNMMILITDEKGDALAWSSSGLLGFSGAKKATPFAAARVAENVVEKTAKLGLKEVDVLIRGVGSGRDSAIRALANHGLNITSIRDITPIPHNGPRLRKARRV